MNRAQEPFDARLRRFAPCVLRWKTLRVSSAPHPVEFESHALGPKKERPPSLEALVLLVGPHGLEPWTKGL